MFTSTTQPKTVYLTPERLAIVARDWPLDVPVEAILAALNATDGPKPVIAHHIHKWANMAGVSRNLGALVAMRRANGETLRGITQEAGSWPDVSDTLRRMAKPRWEFEKLAALVGHWREGCSTAEIGRRLGVTKNAVVGKTHRLADAGILEPRENPIIFGMEPRAPKERAVQRVTLPPLASALQISAPAVHLKPPAEQASSPPAATIPAIATPLAFTYVPSRFAPIPRPAPGPARGVEITGNGKCQFPLWKNTERPTHKYCDKPAIVGSSWCPECRRIVFSRGGAPAEREAA